MFTKLRRMFNNLLVRFGLRSKINDPLTRPLPQVNTDQHAQ